MALKNQHEPAVTESNFPPVEEESLATVMESEEAKSLLVVVANDQDRQWLNAPSVMMGLSVKNLRRRRYLHALTNGALIQELLFLFFQYTATQKGLMNAGVEANSAAITAACLSLSDWLVNVLSVSVPADADSVLFPVREQLLGRWANIEFMLKTVSLLGSYSFGAAADALPLLALLPKDSPRWLAALSNYALIAVNILPGATYYRLFNHAKIAHHLAAFKDFCAYPSLPLKRIYQNPLNFSRYLEVLRSWSTVIGYRALSFAFIAQALAPYLVDPLGASLDQQVVIGDSLALLALSATALNVLFSRMLPTYEQFSALAYDVVTKKEYQDAAKAWHLSTPFMQRVSLFMLCALPNILTSAGWTLLTRSLLSDDLTRQIVPWIVGGVSFFNKGYVEYQAFIAKKALKTLDIPKETITQRLFDLYGLGQLEHPMVVEATEATALCEQLKEVNHVFQQLANSFAAHNRLFDGLLMMVNIGARAARSIGFYGFIKTLAGTVSAYTGEEISDQQLFALCLILAPENFRNELSVFDDSMKEVIQAWLAKCYVEKCRVNRKLSHWETIKVCLSKSHYDFSLPLIERAWQKRCEERSGALSAALFVEPPALPVIGVAPSQGLVDQNVYQRLEPQAPTSRCVLM